MNTESGGLIASGYPTRDFQSCFRNTWIWVNGFMKCEEKWKIYSRLILFCNISAIYTVAKISALWLNYHPSP